MDITTFALDQGGTAKRGCPVLRRLARAADCSADTLYMIATGHKRAGHKLAFRIEQATSGRITRSDLRPDIWGNPASGASDMDEAA